MSDEIGLAVAHALAGDRAAAVALLRRLEDQLAKTNTDPFFAATVYAALGDADGAFAALDRAVKRPSGMVGGIKADVRLEGLRSDPRYAKIVSRLGLPV